MSNVITVNHIKQTPTRFILTGTIALSGSYVQYSALLGEVLNFATATFPLGFVLSNFSGPDYFSALGDNSYGYGTPLALPGAYPNQFLVPLKITTASATELGAGAYPAGITGDNIQFEAHFRKLC
jgi:hypothetical protein